MIVAVVALMLVATSDRANAYNSLYAARERLVCNLPMSGNKQKVIGFDAPSGFIFRNAAYWSVGDSFVDGNNNGFKDDPLGFRTGSIGRTRDLDASDCIDIRLRTTNDTDALPILTPNTAQNECLIWPGRVFDAAGQLYFFFLASDYPGGCDYEQPPSYSVGLGKLTNPDSGELAPVRVGDRAYEYTASPLTDGGYVYLFSEGAGAVKVARVPEAQVAERTSYEYWDGTTWVGPALKHTAQSIVSSFAGTQVTIAYSQYAGRYMMISTCSGLSNICARTAIVPGTGAAALTGGWNAPTTISEACSFLCSYLTWHPTYTKASRPDRIYVSWANIPAENPPRFYFGTLLEIDLDSTPASGTQMIYPGIEFYIPEYDWEYVTYDSRRPGRDILPLEEPGFFPNQQPVGPPVHALVGEETVNGYSAPGVGGAVAWPSDTRGAGRIWTVPSNGIVRLFGEVWLESTLGDGVVAEILLIRQGSIRRVWSKKLVSRSARLRNRLLEKEALPVLAGDQLLLGVRHGNSSRNHANYDLVIYQTLINYLPATP